MCAKQAVSRRSSPDGTLLVEAGGTLDALVDRLQAEEQKSNRPRYKTRRTKDCTEAADSTVGDGESSLAAR